MATKDICPRYNSVGDFGTSSRHWRKIYCNALVFDDGTEMTTATITSQSVVGQVFDTGWINTPSPGAVFNGSHGLTTIPKHCTIWARPNNHDYNGYAWDGLPADQRDDFIISPFQIAYNGGLDPTPFGFCIKFDETSYSITIADNGTSYIFKHLEGNDDYSGGEIQTFSNSNVDIKFIFIA